MSMTSAEETSSHAVSPAERVEAASCAVADGTRRRSDKGGAARARIRRTCILALSKPRLD
jgi:hypothetical protein